MPRNPKLLVRGALIEVCSRMEEGLPLVPSELNCLIVGSIMARAQTLYPVTIVAYSFMGNHFHMMLVIQDPENIPKFIAYVKRESAHAVNIMMGRRQHTVWCEGFDNPTLLDPEIAIKRLNYIYLNPVDAGLCPKVEDWPLSSASWVDFKKDESCLKFKPIPRNKIPYIPEEALTQKEILSLCKELEDLPGEYFTLSIQPHAWNNCFSLTNTRASEELHQLVFNNISIEEKRLMNEREKEGYSYPSLAKLKCQNIRRAHEPKKFGPRMLCLASEKATRIEYLKWIKETYKRLPRYLKKKGIDCLKTLHYPPGFFAPGGFLSSNILPTYTPLAHIT